MLAEITPNLTQTAALTASLTAAGYWIYRERLRVNKFKPDPEFHLLKFITKDGKKLELWKDRAEDEENLENRKTIWKEFMGHSITEEEAKELFLGNAVRFEKLTSKAGNTFCADGKLAFDEEKKMWRIDLEFNNEKNGGKSRENQRTRTRFK